MNILLIGMGFYQYEKEMVKTLEEMGHSVKLVYDAPKAAVSHSTIINKRIRNLLIERHQDKIAKELSTRNVDRVIVIVGRYLTENFLDRIKRDHPHAKLSLYLWDDIGRIENYYETSAFYDSIYSFDPEDCRRYGLQFLPLFYIDGYKYKKSCHKQPLIVSAFFMHSDRMQIARNLLKDNNIPAKIIVVAGLRRWIIWNANKAEKREDLEKGIRVRMNSIPVEEAADLVNGATAVLDIQHPTQRGLTMRTFETLASQTKLITTNNTIRYYDFYNADNIEIIEREKPELPEGFIGKPYKPVPQNIVDKYSLKQWMSTLLGGELKTYLNEMNPYGIKGE